MRAGPHPFILLVEDDPDDQTLTLHALRKAAPGFDVVVAEDGAEALEFLFGTGTHERRDTSHQPALVLLDLKVPKVDGVTTLACIRAHERTALLPVVVLTSSDEERDLADSQALGATLYVRKPLDLCEFIESTCPRILGAATLAHV